MKKKLLGVTAAAFVLTLSTGITAFAGSWKEDALGRYRELGGEILTIGSDGHKPEHLAFDFKKVPSFLQDAGFRYYTVFRGRKAEFVKL